MVHMEGLAATGSPANLAALSIPTQDLLTDGVPVWPVIIRFCIPQILVFDSINGGLVQSDPVTDGV